MAIEQKTVRVHLSDLQHEIEIAREDGWLFSQAIPISPDFRGATVIYLIVFERAAGGTDEWHRLQSRPQAIKSEDIKLTAEEEERIYGVTKQFIDSESEKKIAEFAGALYSNLSQAQEFHDANPDSKYTWDMGVRYFISLGIRLSNWPIKKSSGSLTWWIPRMRILIGTHGNDATHRDGFAFGGLPCGSLRCHLRRHISDGALDI